MKTPLLVLLAGLTFGVSAAAAAPQVTTAAGLTPADIQAAVDTFRTRIGAGGVNNNVGGGPFTNGFRNINWDAVPDAFAAPAALPLNFFNANSPRGAVFATPGSSVRVSANPTNPALNPVRFGELDTSYTTAFRVFSAERLFTPIGSTVIDQTFAVPSSSGTSATTNGFGVIFCDVDLPTSASVEYFDPAGASLGKWWAPAWSSGVSFLGVSFDAGERVARVRITSGTVVLAAGAVDNPSAGQDAVAMDDFIYGEPQPLGSNGRLLNIAARSLAGGTAGELIAGFVVGGTQPKRFLVRGIGPSLAAFGVPAWLSDPSLTVFNSAQQAVATNDNWNNVADVSRTAAAVGAFPLPANSLDAAMIVVLNPGGYTVVVSGAGPAGQVLAEVYELP